MPRRKTAPSQLRQQSLTGFLKPNSLKANGSRDNTARTKPRQADRTARSLPSRVPEPFDQSDTDSGVEAIHFEPKKIASSSDDGDDVQPSSPVRKRRVAVEAESQTDGEMSASSDSDMDTKRKVLSNKMKSPRSRSPSIEVTLPKKRRLAKGVRPPSPEETDNLLLEVNEADIIQSRFRHRQKQTRFQQNLEKLKKRKLKITESSDEQTGEDDGHDSHEPFQGAQKDGQTGDPDEDDDEDEDDDDDDDDADDFVVEDDGVAIPELPVAFNRRTHQDSSHDFKVVCQLFVHLAMMPVDERRDFMEQILKGDDYFLVPFQVIRRKLSDARDSVASSIWRRDYKDALELLPDLTLTKLDFSTPHCDACNVRKKSTVAGWLKGTPYDKLSFEPIIDERNSEDPDDEDHRVTGFSFGRFCAIRTQIYHRLTHWSYHLYQTLSEEIDLVQCPGKKRPFSRSWNLSPPEDTSNPDDITEWLDERGLVSAEWQKLCDLLQRASSLDSWEGGRD